MDEKGKINSEKEYWEYHKDWNKRFKKIRRLIYKGRKPTIDKIEELFDEAERVGLFSTKQIQEWRKKLYKR